MTEPVTDSHRPNIYTVPPGVDFLAALARAVLGGRLPDSSAPVPPTIDLPRITILLPTRRAVRAMQDAFLHVGPEFGQARALLLPKLRPIADGEEEATLIAGLARVGPADGDLDVPPEVSPLERRLILTQLVQAWSRALRADAPERDGREPYAATGARTPAQAAQLAAELARLIDMIETENVSLDRLADLVPEAHSEHWQQTIDFLDIVVRSWPAILADMAKLSPADRRNRLILAEAQRLREAPPEGPVIVAGVTGSIPATAELIRAVAALPTGAIVLPGLDLDADAETGRTIAADHPEHPQFGLLRLLQTLGVEPGTVRPLAAVALSPDLAERNRLLGEVMRPATLTDQWHTLPARFDTAAARSALTGVSYLSAANPQDEAEAIALILREAAEQPGRTAALVSPDRLLARRVAIRLEAWGIRVDDSAGRPFAKTVPGAFLDLVVDVAARHFAPEPLMALLKHPLTRLGRTAFDVRRAARALEIAAFRRPYLGRGLAAVEAALEKAARDVESRRRRGRAVTRLWQDDWDAARGLLRDLEQAYAPLQALFATPGEQPLRAMVEGHVAVAEALAATPRDATGSEELWREEAGVVGAQLFTNLLEPNLQAPDLAAADYADFYRTLVAGEAVRPTIPTHPRIFIWGPFEARLLRPDVIVLGSLNDGTWPEAAEPGPWLNRPMRQELGLPSPEEQIGYAAHDFTQLCGAGTVYLTRSQMIDGDPTVPSRWLLRLQAVLARLDLQDVLQPRDPWLAWARRRDAIDQPLRIARPAPRPPVELRPRRLSVSAVETWIANPYAIFADRILGLEALPRLGEDPDAALRGSVVHEALGRFAALYPATLPPDPAAELLRISVEIFDELGAHPRIAAFWRPRFQRFAAWFGDVEAGLREGVDTTLAEIAGAHVLAAPAGPFTLTARADRIDVAADGLTITDYKTGANLTELAARARDGKRPQLLLEALIARAAGFAGVADRPVTALRYISAAGGDPPGAVVDLKIDDVEAAVSAIADELAALVARYDDPATPYSPARRAQFRYDFDAYAHLARIAEWAGEGQEEGA